MQVSIRLGHTDSAYSVDRENRLDVQLKNTSKLGHFSDILSTVDQYEQFKEERNDCNNYRLILTIVPYCTNVLFNTVTEIVYAEGSDQCDAIIYEDEGYKATKLSSVYGLATPDHTHMVMNTEYSRPGCAKTITNGIDENYVYHPGFDMFDNHILRNVSFKIVNKGGDVNIFNTLGDLMRYQSGGQVMYRRRDGIDEEGNSETIKNDREKHLYDNDDILSFSEGDAVNLNLTEENGWYGFTNGNTIQSRDAAKSFSELNIGRVLNDRKSCEFIDMYPDRTLYSFNPKYNRYRHRLEYNWEVFLTYPYSKTTTLAHENVENHTLSYSSDEIEFLRNGECNALLILSAVRTIGTTGENVVLIRSMAKHGLKRGDTVRFYVDGESVYTKNFVVKNVGDLKGENKEYYFTINDLDFIRELGEYSAVPDDKLEVDTSREYRFARVYGDKPSKYYVRIFRKLPNFKYREQNFPDDGSMTIQEYINSNAKDKDGNMVLFDREQYKLAFETNIYTDDVTQVTFTDTIDINNLVDCFGRPVTEIYATLLKTNYGRDKWYNENKYTDESVEYSHCFGKVSSGLEFSDIDEFNSAQFNKRSPNGDIHTIVNPVGDANSLYMNGAYYYRSIYEDDISISNDYFYGDVIEFNENECIEHILQPFLHRFNTAQRELMNDDYKLIYHDIWSDDWDKGFETSDDGLIMKEGTFSIIEKTSMHDGDATNRHEGYYYQPHYRIALREFGNVNQDSHYDIPVKSVSPVQANGMYLKVTCKRGSGVSVGDTIYLFDDEKDKRYEFVATYLENRVTFYISPKPSKIARQNAWDRFIADSKMNWLDVSNIATPDNDGNAKLYFRRKNENIPSYAIKVDDNKYLWRDVLKPGDDGVKNLPEYAFANNSFYISNQINFYLRRQDPQGWTGLYADGEHYFPNDVFGNIRKESNYEYKEESEVIC